MNIQTTGVAKRLIFSLLLASFLGGCAVYEQPYSGYNSNPYAYGPPVYAGPPVSLDLGFGFYDYGRAGHFRGHGHRGFDRGYRGFHQGYRSFDRGHQWRGQR